MVDFGPFYLYFATVLIICQQIPMFQTSERVCMLEADHAEQRLPGYWWERAPEYVVDCDAETEAAEAALFGVDRRLAVAFP